MRMPLKTRLGVEEAPIEPGLRWLRCEPCEDETPLKLWRFITPAKPLPLLVPMTSTFLPASKMSTAISWPSAVLGGVVGADLGDVAARRDARLLEVAGERLGHLARVDLAVGQLDGAVAVLLRGAQLGDDVGGDLDDGHRDELVARIPDLRHAELGAQQTPCGLGLGHGCFLGSRLS